ncbi:MAG: hypothetical protein WAM85_06275 [Terracidiphilus sp.]
MATNRAQILRHNEDAGVTGHVATLHFSRIDLNHGSAVFQLRPADGTEAPEIPVPLNQIRPNTIEDRAEVWQSLAKAPLDRFRSQGIHPDFVRGYEVQTGDDSTGDPALYLKILVKPTKGPADDETVSQWRAFTDRVQESLLQLRLQRWPYVQLGEWRRKK